MPLKLIREDITRLSCDAIVNAANNSLLGGGGVDGAIHRAAGRELLAECETLGGCMTGEAKITKGYKLPSKYVIHTVGPIWRGGGDGEEELLRSCYRNSLAIAKERGFESVAFPLISSGAYGYPKDQALKIAVEEISAFLLTEEMLVYIVIFDRSSFNIGEKLFDDISSFIDDKYVDAHIESNLRRSARFMSVCREEAESVAFEPVEDKFGSAAPGQPAPVMKKAAAKSKGPSLGEALKNIDESFSEMLLRKIDERNDRRRVLQEGKYRPQAFLKDQKRQTLPSEQNYGDRLCHRA